MNRKPFLHHGWRPWWAALLTLNALAQPPNAPPPGGPPGSPRGRGGRGGGPGPNALLAAQMLAQGDKNSDQQLTPAELGSLADRWFDPLDPDKRGQVTQDVRFKKLYPIDRS